MLFEVIGEIKEVEVIAIENSIRDLARLHRRYGAGRWRKLKGVATVRLSDGSIMKAELHWFQAHGIGKKEMKVKHLLE